jgi:hypothetical protein
VKPQIHPFDEWCAQVQTLLMAMTRGFDKQTDPEIARRRLRMLVTGAVRDQRRPDALVGRSGVWIPAELTEDEKVRFAIALEPRLKRRLPAATWRELPKAA